MGSQQSEISLSKAQNSSESKQTNFADVILNVLFTDSEWSWAGKTFSSLVKDHKTKIDFLESQMIKTYGENYKREKVQQLIRNKSSYAKKKSATSYRAREEITRE